MFFFVNLSFVSSAPRTQPRKLRRHDCLSYEHKGFKCELQNSSENFSNKKIMKSYFCAYEILT